MKAGRPLLWLALGMAVAVFSAESPPGSRVTPLAVPAAGQTGFKLRDAAETGVRFTNELAVNRYITNQIYLNGGGVALGDVDGDGRCDVYLCGIDNANSLYRNLGGWAFQEITAEAGVACDGLGASGAALADLDGDGHLDLIVNSVGQGTHLFANEGNGKFNWITRALPLNPARAGMTAALADIDGDGDLDLYLANYRTETVRDRPQTRLEGNRVNGEMVVQSVDGRPTTEPDLIGRFTLSENGRIQENGEVDLLLRNEGKFQFVAIPFTQGAFLDEDGRALKVPPFDWGLSALFRDLNGDSQPDLYVANDFESPDRIWINQGDGRFRALPRLALRHTSLFSMGVDVGDLNRDGADDILVSDMMMQEHSSRHLRIGDIPLVFLEIGAIEDRPQYSGNTLNLNRGDGTYAEIGWFSHSQASGWTWCPVLLDVDLDGYEDILFPTGHERDMMNVDVTDQAELIKSRQRLSKPEQLRLRMMFDRFDTPDVAFRNRGDLTFEDVSRAWGFTAKGVSQGIALGDLDNDGDLDVVINNLNGPAGIYENTSAAPRVAVRLAGKPGNTRGVGGRITLLNGAVPRQTQEIVAGGRYLSSDDPMRVFAAGASTNRMRLEVTWRSGLRSSLDDVRANQLYQIEEATAQREDSAAAAPIEPMFTEVKGFVHAHVEAFFEDYQRQPLLPGRLSQLGPGVAWYDVNEDGWDDLIIGSGQGGTLALFQNDQEGGFQPASLPFLNRPVSRDQTSVLATQGMILAGSANYEDGLTNGGYLRIYDLKRNVAGDSFLGPTSSTGPLALADVDGDADLELFLGGRVVAGRFPEPADSFLLRNEGGRLVVAQKWEKLGLVSGAVFSDLDLDGDPDLVLACDWGPVRVFRNDRGSFTENTTGWGLAELKGWWTGVATGDFDNDGRPDLVVGNWGLNSQYQASAINPRKMHYGDIDGDEVVDLIETTHDPILNQEVPDRGLKPVSFALPWLKESIGSYAAYGNASVQQLYGDRLDKSGVVDVNTLAVTLFLNRGDHFEARPLPPEAQWTTAMGICVGDCDGDGNDDLFLSQNFFAVAPEAWRQDAGRGLWLEGDGKGNLKPVPAQISGVQVYGEQRGCALSDFDRDGRVDLVVTQNGAATKLYRNTGAKPGLRVQLRGPPGNPHAIGAMLRLKSGGRAGPSREIQAGSGYWSQNSPVQVLGGISDGMMLEIRWPGNRTQAVAIPSDAMEITVDLTGQATKTR